MKKYDVRSCTLLEKKELAPGFFDFVLDAPEFAGSAAAGQFAHVYIPGRTLRRPISICRADKNRGTLRLVFQVRGTGTAELAGARAGDRLDILAPLGRGFPLAVPEKKVLLVGGGIGTPPLLELAAHYKKNAVACLGFRNRAGMILEQDFAALGADVRIATEDGSAGEKGYATELLRPGEVFDRIYACGPSAMLGAVCKIAREMEIPCDISLEERMACGVGACLGCACGLLDARGNGYYGHVCKDGPVFDYRLVREFQQEGSGDEHD